MIRDLGDQDLSCGWLPFIMYNKVFKKRYETFLCFLNIDILGNDKEIEKIDDEKYL
jgi:hypothetical protein